MHPQDTPTSQRCHVTMIRLAGELDYTNSRDITDAVSVVLAAGAVSIVVDVDQVDFMGAAALGALVRARHICRRQGALLTVRCTRQRLRHLFTITGLDSLLEPGTQGPSPYPARRAAPTR